MPDNDWGAYYSGLSETGGSSTQVDTKKKPDDWIAYFGEMAESPSALAPSKSRWEQAREMAEQAANSGGPLQSFSGGKPLVDKYRDPDTFAPMLTGDYWKEAGQNLVSQAKGFLPGMAKLVAETVGPLLAPEAYTQKIITDEMLSKAVPPEDRQAAGMKEGAGPLQPLKNVYDLAMFAPKLGAELLSNPVETMKNRPFDILLVLAGKGVHSAKMGLNKLKTSPLTTADLKAAFSETLAKPAKFKLTPEETATVDWLNKSLEEPGTVYGPGGEIMGQSVPAPKVSPARQPGPTPMPEGAEFARPDLADMRVAEGPQNALSSELQTVKTALQEKTPGGGYAPTGESIAPPQIRQPGPGEVRGLSVEYVDRQGNPVDSRGNQIEYLSAEGGTSHAGQGGFSQEALSRQKTTAFSLLDQRTGKERPLIGVDAIDVEPGPFEVKIQRNRQTGQTQVVSIGAKARRPGPGEVRGLGIEFVDNEGNPISRAEAFARKPRPTTEPAQTEPGKIPVPAVAAPTTPEDMVLSVLRQEKLLRRKQNKGYAEERAARVAEYGRTWEANPTIQGFYEARTKLGGALPKIDREAPLASMPKEVTEGLMRSMAEKIQGYDLNRAHGALLKLQEPGFVLQPSEMALLIKGLGKDLATEIIGTPSKLRAGIIDALGIPRAVMSSADLSFGLRQGIMMAASHPALFSKAFAKQFKYFASEKAFKAAGEAIAKDEYYPLAAKSGLSLTDLGKELAKHEEPYQSNFAGKIPIVKQSGRAYTGMANKLRFDTFKYLIKRAEDLGHDFVGDPKLGNMGEVKLARNIADLVNVATGRGKLGAKLEPSAVALNQVLFSPRLLASRIQALNPVWYAKLEPFARKQALRNLFATIGAGTTILGAAKLAGADVGMDPRSADFGKIKIGNTRIDLWGGFIQYPRIIAQIASGKLISSTTGKVSTLGEGYKPITRADIAQRAIEAKFAPIASFIWGAFRGQNQVGEKFKIGPEIAKRFIPMVAQDAAELYKEDPSLLPLDILGVFGVGLQTYGPRKKKTEWQTGW